MPTWLEPWWLKIVPGIWALLGLGFLIFIHELGHFMAAKRAGVKVEVFSLGVGHFIVSLGHRGTVYALSWLPLGGYVRMTGQQDLAPPPDRPPLPWEYGAKRPWVRMIIISAGVIMNFIGGYLCFTAAFMVGREEVLPIVGDLEKETSPHADAIAAATAAGLRTGDRVLSVNGSSVHTFQGLNLRVLRLPPGSEVTFRVKHADNSEADLRLRTYPAGPRGLSSSVPSDAALLPEDKTPFKLGFSFSGSHRVVVEPNSRSFRSFGPWRKGFRPGDLIEKIAGQPCSEAKDFVKAIKNCEGQPVKVEVTGRNGRPREISVPVTRAFRIGVNFTSGGEPPAKIAKVHPGSAEAAGIKAGETIYLSPDRRPIAPDEVRAALSKSEGNPVKFWVEDPAGALREVELKGAGEWTSPLIEEGGNPLREFPVVGAVLQGSEAEAKGLRSGDVMTAINAKIDRKAPVTLEWLSGGAPRGPYRVHPLPDGPEITWVSEHKMGLVRLELGEALAAGWSETSETLRGTVAIFSRISRGQIKPSDAVSGPAGIAGMAYIQARSGPGHLLWLLGLMGISLALINFLPIPVLDGGHMMFLAWEAVTRKPPSLRVLEVGQVVGLLIIAGLFVLAFWSDISNWLR